MGRGVVTSRGSTQRGSPTIISNRSGTKSTGGKPSLGSVNKGK